MDRLSPPHEGPKTRERPDPIWPRRPNIERFADGDAVFVRGVVMDAGRSNSTSVFLGEAYVGVAFTGLVGSTSVNTQPVSIVTRADAYVPADELIYAKAHLERARAELDAMRAALDGDEPLNAIRAILFPPAEDEDDV